MLILKLLDVNDKEMVLDYVASGIYLREMLDEFANSTEMKDIKSIIIPKADTMFRVLEYIENTYENVYNYLHVCGVTDEEINCIKQRALELV